MALQNMCLMNRIAVAAIGLACGLGLIQGTAQAAPNVSALEELGKLIFFEPISRPKGKQACASCHDPASGWTNPNQKINKTTVAVPGSSFHPKRDPGKIGNLKPPSNAYASFSPPFDECDAGIFDLCGGNFWNGRATGNGRDNEFPEFPGATETVFPTEVFWVKNQGVDPDLQDAYQEFLGPIADQALNPFPNPVEQNVQERQVCQHVRKNFAREFKAAWGENIKCNDNVHHTGMSNSQVAFRHIAVALAAYQASDEVNQFDSTRDRKLYRDCTLNNNRTYRDDTPCAFPLKGLTAQENFGHDLFYTVRRFGPGGRDPVDLETAPPNETAKDQTARLAKLAVALKACNTTVLKRANCAFCHNGTPDGSLDADGTHPEQLYTDHAYHNIGIPENLDIPNVDYVDDGLQEHTLEDGHYGFHKTPTLRNVDKRPKTGFTKAYGHNGYFKNLRRIVHFYNTAFMGDCIRGTDTAGNPTVFNPVDPRQKKNGKPKKKTRCPDEPQPGPPPVAYEDTTAYKLGIGRCANPVSDAVASLEKCWPEPEFPDSTAIPFLLGDLDLNACEEKALVAYLKTLTDKRAVQAP